RRTRVRRGCGCAAPGADAAGCCPDRDPDPPFAAVDAAARWRGSRRARRAPCDARAASRCPGDRGGRRDADAALRCRLPRRRRRQGELARRGGAHRLARVDRRRRARSRRRAPGGDVRRARAEGERLSRQPPLLGGAGAPGVAVTVLVLGGTAEARALAGALAGGRARAISSLAGRVAEPRLPQGEVRVGGFGGPEALAAWLAGRGIAAVVDATHPFAQRLSASAASACATAGVPLLRLERPGWTQRAGDDWHWVDDMAAA